MKIIMIVLVLALPCSLIAQNVGIGVTNPVEKLEVNGNLKVNGTITGNIYGVIDNARIFSGVPYDFLIKNNAGNIATRKGHGAQALNYIIAVQVGQFPSPTGQMFTTTLLEEVKLFAGNFAPSGWMFCDGQLLPINSNSGLFDIIGTLYGGDGQATFALPDLRGAAAVHQGNSPAGYTWAQGEKSD